MYQATQPRTANNVLWSEGDMKVELYRGSSGTLYVAAERPTDQKFYTQSELFSWGLGGFLVSGTLTYASAIRKAIRWAKRADFSTAKWNRLLDRGRRIALEATE